MKKQAYSTEVADKLIAAEPGDKKTKFKDLKKYIGISYDFIGLSTPTQRRIFKEGYSFNTLHVQQQLHVWDKMWQADNCYEVMTQALYFIEKNIGILDDSEVWQVTRMWVAKIDNWAHSDALSEIYSYLLERHPELYPQFEAWNLSANPWERRQSIVGLLTYSRKRKKVLPHTQVLPLVTNLLRDEDYFVQKGIGWTLREVGNAYPEETLVYLHTHVGSIHPAAFTAAIEKLTPEQKNVLKTVRKIKRK